jgi:hypothetical protein
MEKSLRDIREMSEKGMQKFRKEYALGRGTGPEEVKGELGK